jgi:hypothetical protein
MKTPTTLSTEFQSKPNALRSNILDVDSVGRMNEHINFRRLRSASGDLQFLN